MLPYWLLLAFPSLLALVRPLSRPSPGFLRVLVLLYSAIIGLRFQVGGDWGIYLENLQNLAGSSFFDAISSVALGDPGYNLISWLSNTIGTGIYGVNFLCALIFSIGLLVFCDCQPRPWLALAVSTPYLIIVVAMGYTRQSAAIGLALIAFLYLEKKSLPGFIWWILLATMFHKTAIILIVAAIMIIQDAKTIFNKII